MSLREGHSADQQASSTRPSAGMQTLISPCPSCFTDAAKAQAMSKAAKKNEKRKEKMAEEGDKPVAAVTQQLAGAR